MGTQTQINTGIVATLLVLIGTMVYIGLPQDAPNYQEPNYYCLNLSVKMYCNSVSAYYSLPNGKCINKDYGNKLCRSGWELIPKLPIKSSGSGTSYCTRDGCYETR